MLKNQDIKNIINETLKINSPNEKEVISEALVANVKQFNMNTEYLSDANKNNHIQLYKGYVESFNKISAELDAADKSDANSNSSTYRSLKIDETYNMNAIYLHELYFANVNDPNSKITMDSLAYMRLARDFGSFDEWQKDFIACCKAARCGWVVTYYNFYTQTFMNTIIDLHSENVPAGGYPVIVMDVWQHAYYKDYLKDVKTYVIAMMKQFNWNVIGKRFEKADKIVKALRG
jgi:Fe-Mn family superoxide dismutase